MLCRDAGDRSRKSGRYSFIMAHTLNEQSIVIPSGTAADCIELLMSAIETLTGWYRDGYTVYCDTQHTMGIRFLYTGNSSCRMESFFNGNTVIDYISSYGFASGMTIRCHKSTDETVTFLDIGHQYGRFIYALNEDNVGTLFHDTGESLAYAGSPTLVNHAVLSFPVSTNGKKYCITKYPDVINGKLFPSLYVAFGTESSAEHNQIVSFDGEIFRLALMFTASGFWLAFPVSDEEEEET